jgi:hypothetical protein
MIPKFRAWLKNDKEMIDVDEIHFDNGRLDFIGDGITFMRTVDEIELMQSTGLHDKNGKEIFEGDIIITNAHASIVSFGEYTYFEDADTEVTEVGFYLSYLNVSPATYSPFEKFFWEKCQVIGNIHENELDLIMYESWKFNKELEDET